MHLHYTQIKHFASRLQAGTNCCVIVRVLLQGWRHEEESASESDSESASESASEEEELLAVVIAKQVCMSHLMSLWQPLQCSFAADVFAPVTALDCIHISRS